MGCFGRRGAGGNWMRNDRDYPRPFNPGRTQARRGSSCQGQATTLRLLSEVLLLRLA